MNILRKLKDYIFSLENKCLFCNYEIIDKSNIEYICNNCFDKLILKEEFLKIAEVDLFFYSLFKNRYLDLKINNYRNNKGYLYKVFSEILISGINKNKKILEDIDYITCFPEAENKKRGYDINLLICRELSYRLNKKFIDLEKEIIPNNKNILLVTLEFSSEEYSGRIKLLRSNNKGRINIVSLTYK